MFALVFGIFILATLVLCVLIVRWAIKRDVAGRRAQRGAMSQLDDGMGE